MRIFRKVISDEIVNKKQRYKIHFNNFANILRVNMPTSHLAHLFCSIKSCLPGNSRVTFFFLASNLTFSSLYPLLGGLSTKLWWSHLRIQEFFFFFLFTCGGQFCLLLCTIYYDSDFCFIKLS